MVAALGSDQPGRVAQRESARFTRGRSLVLPVEVRLRLRRSHDDCDRLLLRSRLVCRYRQSRHRRRYPRCPGRVAQRESARFTRGRSLVRSQPRPSRASWPRRIRMVVGRVCQACRKCWCGAYLGAYLRNGLARSYGRTPPRRAVSPRQRRAQWPERTRAEGCSKAPSPLAPAVSPERPLGSMLEYPISTAGNRRHTRSATPIART